LVSGGIGEEKVEVSTYGKEKPLDKATVIDLQTRNPNRTPDKRIKDFRATWLAYNRRVDIVLLPTNAESTRFHPQQAEDSEILWQRAKPAHTLVGKEQLGRIQRHRSRAAVYPSARTARSAAMRGRAFRLMLVSRFP
jgi:hypothetical protein